MSRLDNKLKLTLDLAVIYLLNMIIILLSRIPPI